MYDVVIAGAGPAGATAAALLAKKERSVVLVDRASFPRPASRIAWLSRAADPLLKELGIKPDKSLVEPVRDVTFLDADLAKSTSPKLKNPVAYLLDRGSFDQQLVQAAADAGATLHEKWPIKEVRLREDSVKLVSGEEEIIEGRMLLLATGPQSRLVDRVLPGFRPGATGRWTAQVEQKGAMGSIASGAAAVVLGLSKKGAFGLVMVHDERVSVVVSTPGSQDEVEPMLADLCRKLADKGLVGKDLSELVAQSKVIRIPANTALELETHVGKHSLVIGDAGGFVAAASDEGIYPAMWSASIAASVTNNALSSRHTQDTLMKFDARWRIDMAEYLRPPNTDTQFLIPLIFSNQPMADRMAAAFFAGENI